MNDNDVPHTIPTTFQQPKQAQVVRRVLSTLKSTMNRPEKPTSPQPSNAFSYFSKSQVCERITAAKNIPQHKSRNLQTISVCCEQQQQQLAECCVFDKTAPLHLVAATSAHHEKRPQQQHGLGKTILVSSSNKNNKQKHRQSKTTKKSQTTTTRQRGGVSNGTTKQQQQQATNTNTTSNQQQQVEDEDSQEDADSHDSDASLQEAPLSTIPKTISPLEKFCKITIIDGTKKRKYGTTYWVQRNVITLQVLASFKFDQCTVHCHKENSQDVKLMEVLTFKDHFGTYHNLPNGVTVYESQFKKKLPFTSGRPETQKHVWLSADFTSSANTVASCATDKFFVCSRPTSDLTGPQKARTKVHADVNIINRSKQSSAMAHAAQQAAAHMLHDKSASNSMQQQGNNSAATITTTTNSNGVPSSPKNTSAQQYIMFQGAPNMSTLQTSEDNQSPSHDSSSTTSTNSSNDNNSPPATPVANSSNNKPHALNYQSNGHLVQFVPIDKSRLYIHAITPNASFTDGYQEVTLHGQFYIPTSDRHETLTVYFGLLPSPRIDYADATKIVCLTPRRLIEGTVRVTGVLGGKMFDNFVLFTYHLRQEHLQIT